MHSHVLKPFCNAIHILLKGIAPWACPITVIGFQNVRVQNVRVLLAILGQFNKYEVQGHLQRMSNTGDGAGLARVLTDTFILFLCVSLKKIIFKSMKLSARENAMSRCQAAFSQVTLLR